MLVDRASSDEFSPHQTDALILLVGRNPLPNYVAAKLLLKADGGLYLVHTTGPQGTGGVAQRLATFFVQNRSRLIPVDPLDPTALRRQLEHYLARIPPGSVGLNYTGGTKVMAVHTYRAVEEFCEQNKRRAVFSYLNADSLEMRIEPRLGHPGLRRKVAENVEMTIEDIFHLHGVALRGQVQTEPTLPDLARALAMIYETSAGIEAWQCGREILKMCDGRLWSGVKADLRNSGVTPVVIELLENALNPDEAKPIIQRAIARRAGFKSWQEFFLWLQGIWLENWALACIKELGYEKRARSLERQAGRQFEIDVAVMRGYQLFALSCTVAVKPKPAKLKLFEIFTRARQLGGDEARIGLVCAVDDPESLEQEVIREWDAARHQVKVFGHQQLSDLKKHLQTWFDTM